MTAKILLFLTYTKVKRKYIYECDIVESELFEYVRHGVGSEGSGVHQAERLDHVESGLFVVEEMWCEKMRPVCLLVAVGVSDSVGMVVGQLCGECDGGDQHKG